MNDNTTTMDDSQTSSHFTVQGRVERRTHRISDLREQVDEWSSLDKEEKLAIAEQTDPIDKETVYNVTTDRFHEYFVDNLDRNQSGTEDNVSIDWGALGNGGSGTSQSDTDLNNRIYAEQLSNVRDNGTKIIGTLYLDAGEGNGNTYDEIGLFSGNPANLANQEVFMFNHAGFEPVDKNDQKSLTFDVTITFTDA